MKKFLCMTLALCMLIMTISCGKQNPASSDAEPSDVIRIEPHSDGSASILMPDGKAVSIEDFSLPLTRDMATELERVKGVYTPAGSTQARSKLTTSGFPIFAFGGYLFVLDQTPRVADNPLILECLTAPPLLRINVVQLETGFLMGRILMNFWRDGSTFIVEMAAYGPLFPGPTGRGICRASRTSPAKLADEMKSMLAESILPAIYGVAAPFLVALAAVLLAYGVAYLVPLITSGAIAIPSGTAGLLPLLVGK